MIIYNTTTKEESDICLYVGGIDCMRDLSDDECIVYNEEEDRYEADAKTIDWWEKYAEKFNIVQKFIDSHYWEDIEEIFSSTYSDSDMLDDINSKLEFIAEYESKNNERR